MDEEGVLQNGFFDFKLAAVTAVTAKKSAPKTPEYTINIEAVKTPLHQFKQIALENPDLFLVALTVISVHSIKIILWFFLIMLFRHNSVSLHVDAEGTDTLRKSM